MCADAGRVSVRRLPFGQDRHQAPGRWRRCWSRSRCSRRSRCRRPSLPVTMSLPLPPMRMLRPLPPMIVSAPVPPIRMFPSELPVRVLPPWPPRTLRMLAIPPPTPGRGIGGQVDRDGRRVCRVVEPVVAAAAAVDLPGDRLAGAEDELVDSAAAGEVLDGGEAERADRAAVGSGDRPGVGRIGPDELVGGGGAADELLDVGEAAGPGGGRGREVDGGRDPAVARIVERVGARAAVDLAASRSRPGELEGVGARAAGQVLDAGEAECADGARVDAGERSRYWSRWGR